MIFSTKQLHLLILCAFSRFREMGFGETGFGESGFGESGLNHFSTLCSLHWFAIDFYARCLRTCTAVARLP